jgi:hypothetical protein
VDPVPDPLPSLYSSPDITGMIKLRKVTWAGQEEERKAYRVLVGKPGRLTCRRGIILGGFLEK